MMQSNPNDRQLLYQAEEVRLQRFKPDHIIEELSQYLREYVETHFPQDSIRMGLINKICEEASRNKANADSRSLMALLYSAPFENRSLVSPVGAAENSGFQSDRTITTPPSIWPHTVETSQISLQKMKEARTPIRYGDVVFLPKEVHIIVIGDTHGDLASTRRIINQIKKSHHIEKGGFVVFLGDYVHNGLRSWRNLLEVLSFQQQYPGSVILLNGNHEFKESYLTALNEYMHVHWNHFKPEELPPKLENRLPQFDNHYGHLRLDLVRSFGFEEGERIYQAFFEWGMKLPYICLSDNLMLSHSLGKMPHTHLTLPSLLYAKQRDRASMQQLGYEAWNTRRASLHSNMVNNRELTENLLNEFSQLLGVNQFAVGHCHYRSGDTVQFGDNSVTTVVSSAPFSPDSGRYMYQQMMVTREKMREKENLTEGDAIACYLWFGQKDAGVRPMERSIL